MGCTHPTTVEPSFSTEQRLETSDDSPIELVRPDAVPGRERPARAQSTAPTIPVPETIRAEGVPPVPASVRQA